MDRESQVEKHILNALDELTAYKLRKEQEGTDKAFLGAVSRSIRELHRALEVLHQRQAWELKVRFKGVEL